MKLHSGVRQVLTILTILLLLALAFQGITGGVEQLPESISAGQYVQSAAQLIYGICAILCIATVFRWREFAVPVQLGFVAGCVVAGGFAPVSWGETSYGVGLLAAVAALLIASVIVWMLRAAVVPLVKKEL